MVMYQLVQMLHMVQFCFSCCRIDKGGIRVLHWFLEERTRRTRPSESQLWNPWCWDSILLEMPWRTFQVHGHRWWSTSGWASPWRIRVLQIYSRVWITKSKLNNNKINYKTIALSPLGHCIDLLIIIGMQCIQKPSLLFSCLDALQAYVFRYYMFILCTCAC